VPECLNEKGAESWLEKKRVWGSYSEAAFAEGAERGFFGLNVDQMNICGGLLSLLAKFM